jgi:hypothetical protein
MTRWLPIPGYEDRYEVSDDGQVRALPGPGRGRSRQMRVMKTPKGSRGYLQVELWRGDGHGSRRKVHNLMLEAFVGPRPDGAFGLHADDDPDNNTLSNLRWGTPSQNILDIVRNGNHNNARKTHCKWGHPFEGDNLRRAGNKRVCRSCKRRRLAEYRARAA